jgi:transcriptional regulator with XRE-family HTH domain
MAQLAQRTGTSPSQINKLEKGQVKLTTEWMTRLADALGCRTIELLSDAPAPAPHINTELLRSAMRVAEAVLEGEPSVDRAVVEVGMIAAAYDVLAEILQERGQIDDDTIDTLIRIHRRSVRVAE